MVLEAIYVVRHGYRMNWVVDPTTGTYSATVRTPTGIAADPALASYGVQQAEQLAAHLLTLKPQVDVIYSSPYYRCLQTLAPFTSRLAKRDGDENVRVHLEPGLGEFYGLARFDHPSPASIAVLNKHFPHLHAQEDGPIVTPATKGESIPQLHDRIAYCLDRLIARLDADPTEPRTVLICTHAASMIAMGRTLTGQMPADVNAEDFKAFTCGLSIFIRRRVEYGNGNAYLEAKTSQDHIQAVPAVDWGAGKGVAGGWDCEANSDCSFLENGEERGWNFQMEEQRIRNLEEAEMQTTKRNDT